MSDSPSVTHCTLFRLCFLPVTIQSRNRGPYRTAPGQELHEGLSINSPLTIHGQEQSTGPSKTEHPRLHLSPSIHVVDVVPFEHA